MHTHRNVSVFLRPGRAPRHLIVPRAQGDHTHPLHIFKLGPFRVVYTYWG